VVRAERGPVEARLQTTGTLEPHRESKVGPRVSGIVESTLVEEGMHVKEGEALVALESKHFELARDEAKAALAVAEAQLKNILAGTRYEVTEQARSRLQEARVYLENVSAERSRVEALFRQGALHKKAYDHAVTQHEAAEAALRAAEKGLQMALKGATEEEIQVARAETARVRSALNRAEQVLKDAVVRAPFSGVVVKRFVNKGEYVSTMALTPIAWIMDIDPVELELRIPETRVQEVALGNPVEIYPDALPKKVFQGRVSDIIPVVDPVSRTVRVKARIPNADFQLTSGMFCRARLSTGTRGSVIRIPRAALFRQEGQTLTFLVQGGRVRKRVLTIGAVDEDYAEVLSGLAAGDRAVVEGQELLEEGTRVVAKPALTPEARSHPTPQAETES